MKPTYDTELAGFLDVLASVPEQIGWHVIALESYQLLLLADSRDSMPLPLMEAIAGQAGDVVATGAKPGTSWAGCLIRPTEPNLETAAGKLRGTYAIGTTDAADDDESGPF